MYRTYFGVRRSDRCRPPHNKLDAETKHQLD